MLKFEVAKLLLQAAATAVYYEALRTTLQPYSLPPPGARLTHFFKPKQGGKEYLDSNSKDDERYMCERDLKSGKHLILFRNRQ